MKKIIISVTFVMLFSVAFAQSFITGDKIEAYNSGGWYKGSIVEIGTGNYEGYYRIAYDGYSQSQWIKASNLRLQKVSASNAENDHNGPRNGRYIILSYGNVNNPIRIGYFELFNGKYIYYDLRKNELGRGSFSYNAANKTLQWTDGPFKQAHWSGKFEIDREGKTHKIRLNGATVATNSTDSN